MDSPWCGLSHAFKIFSRDFSSTAFSLVANNHWTFPTGSKTISLIFLFHQMLIFLQGIGINLTIYKFPYFSLKVSSEIDHGHRLAIDKFLFQYIRVSREPSWKSFDKLFINFSQSFKTNAAKFYSQDVRYYQHSRFHTSIALAAMKYASATSFAGVHGHQCDSHAHKLCFKVLLLVLA